VRSFQFPLESVLRWRKTQHAQEEEKLNRLVAHRQKLEQDLRDVDLARRQSSSSQLATGSDFQVLAKFLIGLKAKQAQLVEALKESAVAIQRQQATCIEAHRRVELLESLRSKRLQTWQYEHDCELESLAADAYLAKRTRER
jgi:flagellar biosynthesis chaperone FliJ